MGCCPIIFFLKCRPYITSKVASILTSGIISVDSIYIITFVMGYLYSFIYKLKCLSEMVEISHVLSSSGKRLNK